MKHSARKAVCTSWPSLLWPEPNILLYNESRELLKSDFSKLWLSKTSRVWRTLPMVNPKKKGNTIWYHLVLKGGEYKQSARTKGESFLTCSGFLTLIKRPPELHSLTSLLNLLLDLSQLCTNLQSSIKIKTCRRQAEIQLIMFCEDWITTSK